MRRLLLGLLPLLLAACAAPHAPAPARCVPSYGGRLSAIPSSATGRAGVVAGFELELGSADSGSLAIVNPLGQAVAEAGWDAAGAHLAAHGLRRDYPSFESMLQDELGLSLPRQALADWMRGRPSASAPARSLAAGGFEQLGWQINPGFEAGALHRLRISRVSGESLTLVFDRRDDCTQPAAPGLDPAQQR